MLSPLASSAISTAAGWAMSIPLLAAVILFRRGQWADLGVTSIWIGVFAGLGWAVFVAPVATRLARIPVFSDLRIAWAGWAAYATVVYIALLVPFFRDEVLVAAWLPAYLGAACGLCFALLMRRGTKAIRGSASTD
jgi:hypothetical protein